MELEDKEVLKNQEIDVRGLSTPPVPEEEVRSWKTRPVLLFSFIASVIHLLLVREPHTDSFLIFKKVGRAWVDVRGDPMKHTYSDSRG